jgi:hypothetical protein
MTNGGATINFYSNDPSAGDAPLKRVPYQISNLPQKWEIVGNPVNPGLYDPNTPEFQTCQVNMAFFRCTNLWNRLFQGSFDTWSQTDNLKIYPLTDFHTQGYRNGFNAFYSRQSGGLIRFFFDKDAIRNKLIYTCESCDICNHEEGHAILDSVVPELWGILLPEVTAFHEAFGDCSSMLTVLTDEDVRKAFSKVSDPLHESNLVSRLAEEMGHGIFSRYGRNASSQESLRDAVNDFKYTNPNNLPDSGPDTQLVRGGHSFSRVFSGAFYGALVRMYQLLKEELQDNDKALRQAADDIGSILANALLATTAGTPSFYADTSSSMLKVDQLLFGGKYKQAITDSLVEKGILSSGGGVQLQSATGSAKAITDVKVPEDIDETQGKELVKNISEDYGLPDPQHVDAWVKKSPDSNSLIICGLQNTFKKLTAGKEGLPDEIEAYAPSGFSIIMDTKNNSLISHTHISDVNTADEEQNYLEYLMRTNRVYVPNKGKKLGDFDVLELAATHKNWYLSEDNKLLRAYFA